MPWTLLGEGSYNRAYLSGDGQSVLKIQKKFDHTKWAEECDMPERSVRLWNELNPHLRPAAYVADTEFGRGWVCPFVPGVQAPDLDIQNALIDIFNSSGRIIIDAISRKNFVKTPDGKIVCLDIGMALQMEREDEKPFEKQKLVRRKSVTSLVTWAHIQKSYDWYFSENRWLFPQAIQTIKALLFIKESRPDIFDVTFLRAIGPDLLARLANAYDKKEIPSALELLEEYGTVKLKSEKSLAQPALTHMRDRLERLGSSEVPGPAEIFASAASTPMSAFPEIVASPIGIVPASPASDLDVTYSTPTSEPPKYKKGL